MVLDGCQLLDVLSHGCADLAHEYAAVSASPEGVQEIHDLVAIQDDGHRSDGCSLSCDCYFGHGLSLSGGVSYMQFRLDLPPA